LKQSTRGLTCHLKVKQPITTISKVKSTKNLHFLLFNLVVVQAMIFFTLLWKK